MITWDEPKRRENIRKHKIDLADLEPIFDYPMVTVEDSVSATESFGCRVSVCGVDKWSF